jgi:hypothetical protein
LGQGDQLRIFYAPSAKPVRVSGLKPGSKYLYTELDPVTGVQIGPSETTTDAKGYLLCPTPLHGHDWVGALERKR